MADERQVTCNIEELLSHQSFLRGLARGLLIDAAGADDVVQETWMAALRSAPRDLSRARPWLARIAANFARQENRSEGRRSERERRAARFERVPSTAEILERESVRAEVVKGLMELNEPYRAALLLRYYEGLGPNEIARRLGVSVETVRARIQRGLSTLALSLDGLHGGDRKQWGVLLAPLAEGPARCASAFSVRALAWCAACGAGVVLVLWAAVGERVIPGLAADPSSTDASTSSSKVGSNAAAIAAELAAESQDPNTRREVAIAAGAPTASGVAGTQNPAAAHDEIRGVVVDSLGQPIASALVFAGNQIRARGDEPFKPFKPERIQNGVLTAFDGSFSMPGPVRWITAWHRDHSARTVRATQAASIALPAPVELRGRLFTSAGTLWPGAEVVLDRVQKTATNEFGVYSIPGVQPGIRGLELPGRRWIRLDVERVGNAVVDVGDITAGIDAVEILLEHEVGQLSDRQLPKGLEGALVGLGSPSSMDGVEFEEGRALVKNVLPGSYLLLLKGGYAAAVEIEGSIARARLGGSCLVVHAPAGTRVYAVPSGSDDLVQLMAGRMATVTAGESGEARFEHFAEGRCDVGVDREGIFASVDVGPNGGEVRLEL